MEIQQSEMYRMFFSRQEFIRRVSLVERLSDKTKKPNEIHLSKRAFGDLYNEGDFKEGDDLRVYIEDPETGKMLLEFNASLHYKSKQKTSIKIDLRKIPPYNAFAGKIHAGTITMGLRNGGNQDRYGLHFEKINYRSERHGGGEISTFTQ